MIRKLFIAAACLFFVGISVTHAQAPVADFSSSVTAGCGPLSVTFKDLSTNTPLYWEWDFGDGSTAAVQNPTAVYRTPGTYTVTLIARNRSGADAIRKTDLITVYPFPAPMFTSDLTLGCAPATIQFIDQSAASGSSPGQATITAWSWDLGDGTTSTQANPAHTYTQTGYYNVSLKVTNSGGCANAIAIPRYIRIVDGVQPNFTFNQTSAACSAPYTLSFVNQTAGPGKLTYSWDLGNGASPAASSDTSPININYPATGNYDVTLKVSSSLGCSGSITQTFPLSTTTATFTGPDVACVNTPVTFTNGTSPAPLSAVWDFGDGTGSTSLNPTKAYTTNGTYTITLTDKYAACSGTTTRTISVSDPPAPVFTADKKASCSAPLTVNFTDQSTGSPAKWLWDFGDGQTSTAQNPSHTYASLGLFTVKLTTTNAGGCSSTTSLTNYIEVEPPTSSVDIMGACVASTPTNNTISPVLRYFAVDGAQSFLWSAPGADNPSSTLQAPTFTYATPGVYSLTLTLTTKTGCTLTNTFSGVVDIGTPVLPSILKTPDPVCGPGDVTFSDPQPSTPINELKWIWNFGDGPDTTTNQPSIVHSFNSIGTLPVKHTLTHNGCPQTTTGTITVNPPSAGFRYLPECGTGNPYAVDFIDTSKTSLLPGFPVVPPLTYSWAFGDGGTDVIPNPTHIYAPTPNTYTVSLTVSEGNGCSSTFALPVRVGPVPIDFTISRYVATTPDTIICSGIKTTYTATTPDPTQITGYYWHWDDTPPESYIFTSAASIDLTNVDRGVRVLTLVIQQSNGCIDSVKHNIRVDYPDALFTTPAGACKNAAVTFTDQSKPNPDLAPGAPAVTDYFWDFGDGNSSATPTHTYTDTGLYTPQLTIKDALTCARTYISTTPIHITSPIANFGGPDSFYCPKKPLLFKDSSIGVSLVDSWQYGDGNTDNTGIHSYPANGSYTVTLTVTDQFSCTSAITKPIRIQSPIAAFDIADTTGVCVPLQTNFTAHGQFYDSLYWNFGDGSTSTLPTTAHFYNTLGIDTAKLFVQGPGGCLDSASRRVLLFDPNTYTKLSYGPPLTACDSVPVIFNITPPDYTRFSIVFGDGPIDSSQNRTPHHTYHNPGSYTPTIVLTDVSGCIVNTFNPIGPLKVLGSVPFVSLDPHAFCDSGIVTFTDYTITNDGIVSETLDFGDGNSQTHTSGVADFNVDHFYNTPGTFLATLHVVTNTNCAESYTDTVKIHQTPHPVIAVASFLCTGIIQFNGNTTVPQTEPVIWAWDLGNGTSSKDQNTSGDYKPGNYTVRLKTADAFGCTDTISQPLLVNPLPEIKGPREITTPVGLPLTIPFTYSTNVDNWSWTPTDHLDCSNCANPVATLIFKEEYKVTVTDLNNCTASDSVLIITICNDKNYFIPNTFSPNGDGVNDYFYPRGSNLYNIQSLRVFNRWGQLVFERKNFPANDATMGWDGNINGRPAPVDAYVYIAEVVCNNAQVVALHGDVTLVR